MPIPVAPHPLGPDQLIASARVFRRALEGCDLSADAEDAAYWACFWRAVEAHATEGVPVPWFVLLVVGYAPEPWQSRSREAFGLPAVGEREDFDTEDGELAEAFADYLFDSLTALTSTGISDTIGAMIDLVERTHAARGAPVPAWVGHARRYV